MTTEVNAVNGHLAELIQQAQAGQEVVLTQDHKPVARIVPVAPPPKAAAPSLRISSLSGHRVLTPLISPSELADEMFDQP